MLSEWNKIGEAILRNVIQRNLVLMISDNFERLTILNLYPTREPEIWHTLSVETKKEKQETSYVS